MLTGKNYGLYGWQCRLPSFFQKMSITMRLTIKNISAFLLEKGLLEPRSFVDGNFMVTQAQNRNAIFKIHIQGGKSLFVKQLVNFDPQNTYFLQKDATCLWLIKNEAVFKKLSPLVPEYYGYDPEKQVLIVEYLPEARNLEEVYQAQKGLSPELYEQVAAILATYHFKLEDQTLTNRSVQFFTKQLPWTFQLATSSGATAQQLRNVYGEHPVVQYLQRSPEFLSLMKSCISHYQFSTLIHGDIKWVNFILKNEHRANSLKIIDWELADIGDPLWDVAGVVQSIFTSKVLLNASPAPYPGAGHLTEAQMKQSFEEIRSFWEFYCTHRKLDAGAQKAALKKVLQFSGMRLVQTAFEHNVHTSQLMPNAIQLLQISYALLQNPDALLTQISQTKNVRYETNYI